MKTLPIVFLVLFAMAHISAAYAEVFTATGDINIDAYNVMCHAVNQKNPIANGRAARLHQQLVKFKATPDTLLPQVLLNSIASDYQPVVNEAILRAQEIKKKSSDPKLHAQDNINNPIKLVIRNSVDNIAGAMIGSFESKIYIPARLIINLMQKRQAEQRRKDELASATVAGIFCIVPLYEFDDAMRLIIAHEVTHIWLHGPGQNVYEREIEADAWGIILSNFDAEISKYNAALAKASATMYADTRNAQSPINASNAFIMFSKRGFEIADILYDDIITDRGRQSGAERRKNIKEKYDEIQKQLQKQLEAKLQKAHDSITSMPEYQEDEKRRRAECLNKLDKVLVNNRAEDVLGKDSRTNSQKEFEAQFECDALAQMQWLEFCRKNPKLESCASLGDLVPDSSATKETTKYQMPKESGMRYNPSADTFSTTGDFSMHILITTNNGVTDKSTFAVKTKPNSEKEYCDAFAKTNGMTLLSCTFSGATGAVDARMFGMSISFKTEWTDR